MQSVIEKIEAKYRKNSVVDVKSGDTVRVHQKIVEGGKERTQIFEGVVISTRRKGSLTSRITVRKIASGVGVEKSFMLHSPNVLKIEVTKRGRVRRKYLGYLKSRSGKSTRLESLSFDSEAVNYVEEVKATPEEVASTEEPAEETVSAK